MYQVFRLITSFWTYVVLLALIILIMTFTKIPTFSFRRLSSRSTFTSLKSGSERQVAGQAVADKAVQFAYVNISLGHINDLPLAGYLSGTELHGSDQEKAIQLTKILNEIRQQSMYQLQQSPPDVKFIMDSASTAKRLINQGNSILQSLASEIQGLESQFGACRARKQLADENYNRGLTSYNSALIEQSTRQAQEANTCISTTTTKINSINGIRNTLQTSLTVMSNYITLIDQNKKLFVEYADTLSTTIPSQLLKLQQQLQKL